MKRLGIDSKDRLVGIRPREMRDFYAGCNEPGNPGFMVNAAEFMRLFCQRCRRLDCVRARGIPRTWEERMATQVEYLLNDPQFSDMADERHVNFSKMMFESLTAKAERLEIAAARQDWEIPEGPTDGFTRMASGAVTTDFDVAVRELARVKGKADPDLPREQKTPGPAYFQEAEEADSEPASAVSDLEYETQYPSTSVRGKSYRVALSRSSGWSCECEGFRHLARCKHLAEVRAWYEQEQEGPAPDPEPVRAPSAPPAAATPPVDPRIEAPRPINTPMPQGGVLIGEGAVPVEPPKRPPKPLTQREVPDPWAPRKDQVVEPGATVTVRSKRR